MVRVLRLACGAAVSAAALLLADAAGDPANSRNSKESWDCNWDRRDPVFLENERKQKGLPPPVPRNDHIQPGTRHLLLVRHAEYDLNGLSDESRALTDKGRQQAKLTAMRLANLGFHYDAIIHSSMKRAVETAQIIQTKIPGPELQSSDLLREGMPYRPDPLNHWRPEMKYFTDGARIEAAFRECFHRAEDSQNGDTYVIIVCHANVIRYFVCRALQFPPQGWLRMSLNHGSITWISIRPNGRVSLKALGDSGFMPPDLLTH